MLSDKDMPKGPKGQKRPADVISNAVHVMRIATGEIQDAMGADKVMGRILLRSPSAEWEGRLVPARSSPSPADRQACRVKAVGETLIGRQRLV